MNTPENYAKQIKNAKRHIEKREKTADAKHIKARLRKARKELNAMECDLEELPLYISMKEIILIYIVTTIIVFLSTLYPAIKASRLKPVEALKHE